MSHDPTIKPEDDDGISSSTFNPEDYFHHLDGMDITEEKKYEIIEALRFIMQTFVDIGFGNDSTQNIFREQIEKKLLQEQNPDQHKQENTE